MEKVVPIQVLHENLSNFQRLQPFSCRGVLDRKKNACKRERRTDSSPLPRGAGRSVRRPAGAGCALRFPCARRSSSGFRLRCPVFIKDPGTLTEELDKLASLTTAILLDTGAVISAKPFLAGAHRARTAFMHDLRRDGLDL